MMCDTFENCIFISTLFVCYWLQVPVPDAQWGQKNLKHQNLEQRSLLYGLQGEGVVHAPKTLSSPKGFTKAFLKARWERGVVSCCKLLGLGILCCCSCPQRSGQDVPINLQQEECYCLSCNFLTFIWMDPERSEPWEWAILYISGYRQHFFLQKVHSQQEGAHATEHKD